jgi:CRP/FNR family transcriptional regulator, cyclic AMP receptor protein
VGSDVFRAVPEQELRRAGRRRRFDRGEVVFHRDDPGDSLHLVVKGRFALRVMTPLGDTAVLAVRGPGDTFGEMALLADEPKRSATVAALEAAETFAVYRGEFDAVRRRYPSIDAALFRFLVREVRAANERLLDAIYTPAEKRVRRRLLDLAAVYGDGETITIPLTQEAIAELAVTSRATVNQVLRDEERREIVRLHRGRIEIVDRTELARRAR